jgi:hypothetical protein
VSSSSSPSSSSSLSSLAKQRLALRLSLHLNTSMLLTQSVLYQLIDVCSFSFVLYCSRQLVANFFLAKSSCVVDDKAKQNKGMPNVLRMLRCCNTFSALCWAAACKQGKLMLSVHGAGHMMMQAGHKPMRGPGSRHRHHCAVQCACMIIACTSCGGGDGIAAGRS